MLTLLCKKVTLMSFQIIFGKESIDRVLLSRQIMLLSFFIGKQHQTTLILLLFFLLLFPKYMFNIEVDVVYYIADGLVFLFQFLMVTLHLNSSSCANNFGYPLKDFVGLTTGSCFHQMCLFLEVLDIGSLFFDCPGSFSRLSKLDPRVFLGLGSLARVLQI